MITEHIKEHEILGVDKYAEDLVAAEKTRAEAAENYITSQIAAGGNGNVFGPASSAANNISVFADATGKTIKDSGILVGSIAKTSDVTTLGGRCDALSSSVSDMAATVTQHSQTLADHGSRITTTESDIDELQDASSDHGTRITTIEEWADAVPLTDNTATPTAHASKVKLFIKSAVLYFLTPAGVLWESLRVSSSVSKTSGKPLVWQPDGSIGTGEFRTGDVTSQETSSTVDYLIGFASSTGKLIKSLGVKIGNASGNVPLSNNTKCEGLYAAHAEAALRAYGGNYNGTDPLAYISAGKASFGKALFYIGYNASATTAPALDDIDNWVYDVDYDTADDSIYVVARKTNARTDRASWCNKYQGGIWGEWVKIVDAGGSAINANSLGGVAAANYALKSYAGAYSAGTRYAQLANGLTLQWGPSNSSWSVIANAATESVTFPIAFPTACITVIPVWKDRHSPISAITQAQCISKSASGCVLQYNSNNSESGDGYFTYIAIGY